MTKISAVLFDYGLVLSGPPDPAAWERLKAVFGSSEEAFHAAYWKFRHEYDRGTLNSVRYWQAVAADLGQAVDTAQIATLNRADVSLWTQPNEEMIAWATALQRAGVKTGILSNIGDAMEEGVVAACPWLSEFTHHTFSHRLLMAKPEVAIFAHAATGLGVPPTEVLFIDDREDNIAAAREAGMIAVQYTGHDAFVKAMQHAGLVAWLSPNPSHT